MPTKIIKEESDTFSDFVHLSINVSINNGDITSFLKLANVNHVLKKGCKKLKR